VRRSPDPKSLPDGLAGNVTALAPGAIEVIFTSIIPNQTRWLRTHAGDRFEICGLADKNVGHVGEGVEGVRLFGVLYDNWEGIFPT
jgi:hypothetical protein